MKVIFQCSRPRQNVKLGTFTLQSYSDGKEMYAHWIDRPLVKGNEDLGTRVLANVINRNSVFVWSTESKPGRPHRIRVEANIKYAVSAYHDTCRRTLGFQHGALLCIKRYLPRGQPRVRACVRA